jgi:transposase
MPNYLKMELINAILALRKRGWSKRRIARELNVDRHTVRRYLREEAKSPAIPTAGVCIPAGEPPGENPPLSTAGNPQPETETHPVSTAGPGAAESGASGGGAVQKSSGRPSKCDPHAEAIRLKLEQGLTAQRIYQDLVGEAQFQGSYEAVKRFVQRLKAEAPVPIQRIEVQPGEEVQVDFGSGAPIVQADGKRRKTHVFRMVLSYSRKAFSQAVLRQDTETFIRCLESGFRSFGGVTKTLNLDNLKAAVLRADWHDPELNPKLESFCRHYGVALLPCLPRRPEHKGKTESSIKHLKGNALKGRTFTSVAAENVFLANWESTVADRRIHGTTRRQVAALFEEEKKALLPLPPDLFPCFSEARRTVHRDAYVEVEKAYYDVPPEYIGRIVWARWDNRCVRIFNQRWEQVGMHAKLEPGQFTKVKGIGGGAGSLEQNISYWLRRAGELGQPCGDWAQGLVEQRGPIAIRSLIGLVQLTSDHSFKAINQACACALSRGAWRLRDVRALLRQPQPSVQTHFAFSQSHPLIRNLAEYGLFIRAQNL